MRGRIGALALLAAALGACSGIPTEPVRINEGEAELAACRRIGSLGEPVRTDAGAVAATGFAGAETSPQGILAANLGGWRQAAVAAGASDILLSRQKRRDWSYVEPIGYACPR